MAEAAPPHSPDGTGIIAGDPWLAPFAPQLRERYSLYCAAEARLASTGGLLGQISQGHRYLGFTRGENYATKGVWYREWAPHAGLLSLVGDFNDWDRWTSPMRRNEFGVWEIFLPDDKYRTRLVHESRVKVHVLTERGDVDRIPAYIRRVVQDAHTNNFTGQYWDPPEPFVFVHPVPQHRGGLRIYEAHIGMAQEEAKIGTFDEFTANVLPRIAAGGYNAVQLMAVAEHPYYASFGYHVSSLFAVSSRFGTPEQLKHLIDTAHSLGVIVLLDLVHSHAVKNTQEGLNLFDGTEYQYFHAPPRGYHAAWDSMLWDYAKFEVQRLLLSNVRYWLEEFHFDGFRFDGVTSMLYLDHGMGKSFSGYEDYFSPQVDREAITYLQLANELAHRVNPAAITIAEDFSGMVGAARPVAEGGLGFDYRLAMGVPDYWIKILKEKRDEDWNLGEMFATLLNRRRAEKNVGYAESHDQALVGDKTIAFRLIDKDMYWHMNKEDANLVVERGLALHKMIRLLSFSLAGEAYLNFMGNEFGHPEWVDFPREGNGWSYQYARRQWSLADNPQLRYGDLARFDLAMQRLDEKFNLLESTLIEHLWTDEGAKQLIYRRGPLVFAFNFHAAQSYTDLRIGVPDTCDYREVLNTDSTAFAGFGRSADDITYPYQKIACNGRGQSVRIYLPSRSAQVLAPCEG